jgi:hypothetical protein
VIPTFDHLAVSRRAFFPSEPGVLARSRLTPAESSTVSPFDSMAQLSTQITQHSGTRWDLRTFQRGPYAREQRLNTRLAHSPQQLVLGHGLR